MGDRVYSFGAFLLDAGRGMLLRDNAAVPVGHRGLMLLESLLAAEGRVVSKADLMDAAWPEQAIEESNLSVQIAALRKANGTRPDGEEWIATVPRVGYQFMPAHPPTFGSQEADRRQAADSGPTIAVLPFSNLSANPDHAFFADGMTDDIIAALARVGELFVISRSSSHALKGRGLSAKDAARELGARLLLEGSVRASDKQVRVMAQLTDGESGNSIWAERYDGSPKDIFAFQDDLTRNIVQALQITLSKGEAARLWEGQTRNLRAWEKGVPGFRHFHRYTTADNEAARRLLEEAIAIDPAYTGAMAWLVITHLWDARYNLSVDRPEAIAKAERWIASIEAVSPRLPQLFTVKCYASFLRGDHDGAVRWGREAVRHAPGDFRAHSFLGKAQIYAGDMAGALASFTDAMRLSPRPDAYLHYYLAIIHMWLGHLDKALGLAEENQRHDADEPYGGVVLAAIHGFAGDVLTASQAIARLLMAMPSFSLKNIRHSEMYRDPAYLDRLCDLLRSAGLPD